MSDGLLRCPKKPAWGECLWHQPRVAWGGIETPIRVGVMHTGLEGGPCPSGLKNFVSPNHSQLRNNLSRHRKAGNQKGQLLVTKRF